MAYLKPQAPLMNGEDYVYPLTTADQVILSDGTRLEKNGEIVANDSEKLGGVAAADYLLASAHPYRSIVNPTSVDDIPINTFGVINGCGSDIPPASASGVTTWAYFYFGNDARKTLIFFRGNGSIYTKQYHTNAWQDWQVITPTAA